MNRWRAGNYCKTELFAAASTMTDNCNMNALYITVAAF
jgi:hypothetical protein